MLAQLIRLTFGSGTLTLSAIAQLNFYVTSSRRDGLRKMRGVLTIRDLRLRRHYGQHDVYV